MVSRDKGESLQSADGIAEPVLILMPTGRDAAVAGTFLHEAGMHTHVCHDMADFCTALAGAAAGLIAAEALPTQAFDLLLPALQRQPVWSDTPLILLTTRATTTEAMWQFVQKLGAVGNVTLLERPLNQVTLLSALQVALRARRRQHDIRQLQAELERRLSEQTAMLEKLHESEMRFQLLANAAPVLIWINGPDGCEFVNHPYLEFLGVSHEADVRGYNWVPYIHPDDREAYVGGYLAALAARAPFAAQFRFRRADGVYRWFRSVGTPRLLPDDTFLGYVGCSFDITERREIEAVLAQRVAERTAALEQAHDDLRREMAERQRVQETLFQQEKLAALGTLLANVAHELNNPLAVAAMQLDNLHEAEGTGAWSEDLETLRQAVERCQSVVQSFLALARQQPPTRHAVALPAVIGDVLVLLGRALEVDGITVERHLPDDLPPVWADAHQLHHVVANLITNAHHALREIDLPRYLQLTVAATADRRQIILEVTDNGPGIPEALQRRIFDPFFTTKPQGVGSGLGLPLCRSIVEGHGGTLRLVSQPGHGTTVSVTLPVAAAAVQPPEVAPTPAEPAQRQRGTVLLIDDEPGVQRALRHLLQRSGHAITTAANGREGLAALEARSYEVILCDMRMPDLDGPGFYRELEHRHPQLVSRLIFLTGDVLSPEIEAFFAQVDRPRLVKPFKAQEVRRVIQQVLEAQ